MPKPDNTREAGGSHSGTLTAFLLGVATGAVAAVLWAPARGPETRERVKRGVREGLERTRRAAAQGREAYARERAHLATAVDHGRESVSKVVGHAEEAMREGRDAAARVAEHGREAVSEVTESARRLAAEGRESAERLRREIESALRD